MELFTPRRRRRSRHRVRDRGTQRRTRAVGRAAPRPVSWWLVVALSALALWLPLSAGAQGLRSTGTSISLIAIRPPDTPRIDEDVVWDVGTRQDTTARIHLVDGPAAGRLYVRDANGRLQALGGAGVPVRLPLVFFRIMNAGPAGAPRPWRVILRGQRADTPWERAWELPPVHPR